MIYENTDVLSQNFLQQAWSYVSRAVLLSSALKLPLHKDRGISWFALCSKDELCVFNLHLWFLSGVHCMVYFLDLVFLVWVSCCLHPARFLLSAKMNGLCKVALKRADCDDRTRKSCLNSLSYRCPQCIFFP